MINYKKLTAAMAAGIIAIFTITGCAMPWQKAADDSSSNVSTVSAGNLSQSGENAPVSYTHLTLPTTPYV